MKKRLFPLFLRLFRMFISINIRSTTFRFINLYRSSNGKCAILTRPFHGLRISNLKDRPTVCGGGRADRLFTLRCVAFCGAFSLFLPFLSPFNMTVSQGICGMPTLISRRVISRRNLSQYNENRNRPFSPNRRVSRAKFSCIKTSSRDVFKGYADKTFPRIYIASSRFDIYGVRFITFLKFCI